MSEIHISIVIRTLNESKYIGELLHAISIQNCHLKHEVILIDSGSTDNTVEIASKYGCRIFYIDRKDFSFGRSLNRGCEKAKGKYLVIISGHCVPISKDWLSSLIEPLEEEIIQYSYGKQIAGNESFWSESMIMKKYFQDKRKTPQEGFFCNNANSALLTSTWLKYKFDEKLTGLEDMELAKRLINDGGKLGYVPEATVIHYHRETWKQIERRFEREAIALREFCPEIRLSIIKCIVYLIISILNDLKTSGLNIRTLIRFKNIFFYRYFQYRGSYKGSKINQKLTLEFINNYFYPIAKEN